MTEIVTSGEFLDRDLRNVSKHSCLRTIDFIYPFFGSDAKKHHEYNNYCLNGKTRNRRSQGKPIEDMQRRVKVNAHVQNLTHSFGPLYVGVY